MRKNELQDIDFKEMVCLKCCKHGISLFCLAIICSLLLCSCGGSGSSGGNNSKNTSSGSKGLTVSISSKTFGDVSKGLMPPNDNTLAAARRVYSFPKSRQDELEERVQSLIKRNQLADFKAIARYGNIIGPTPTKNIPVDKNYKQVSIFRGEKGSKPLMTLCKFKFYKINLNADNTLPKNESDIKVEEVKPKTIENFELQVQEGEKPPDVFYYCEKKEFQTQAFFIVSDKLYLAVPYYGQIDKNNEQTITTFVMEPTEFLKINVDKLDKSYESSRLFKVLFEDYAVLNLILNSALPPVNFNNATTS